MHARAAGLFASSLALAVVAAACGSPAEPTTPAPSTTDGGVVGRADAATAPPGEGPPIETFLAGFPPAFCDFLTTCKNDGVEIAVGLQMSLMSLVPTMKDRTFGDRWDRLVAARETKVGGKKLFRWRPTRDECTAQIALLVEGYALTAESLKPRIGKTLRYDAAQAARCMKATHTPLPVCQQTNVVPPDANDADLDKAVVANGQPYSDHFEPCTHVLVGLVEPGQPCQDEFDCKGIASCDSAEGGGRVCKERITPSRR